MKQYEIYSAQILSFHKQRFHSFIQLIVMIPENPIIDVVIKKDFFVKSRKDNIKDQFDFINVLGKGAYGTVYKAQTKDYPNTIRAIKVIKKKNIKNQQALIDQVTILRQCDHPSIVKMYETYEDDQYLCMVLDYCEGGELFQRLEKHGSFSQRDARDVFLQMVKIIKYMHSNNICHRDLKPQNFLMFNQDTLDLKLTDFGLSTKWITDLRKQLKETGRNKILGTSYYIAPEVLNKDYNESCDVWSLGVLLYILVSACPPFDGADDNEILRSVQKLSFSLDIPQMKKVSPELKDLIKRILVPEVYRISVDQILSHPWMTGKSNEVPLKLDFSKMRQFAQFSRFKTVVVAYIASQLPEKQIHALGNAFRQVDKNSDGYLTIQQLREVIERQQQNLSYKQLKDLIETIDTDKNGKINYNQFLACCLQSSYMNNERYLKHIFNYFDINKDGSISCDQFKSIIAQCGIEHYRDKSVEQIIADVDINNDGKIDYEEFLKSMSNSYK